MLAFLCTTCSVSFEHRPECPMGPCSKMALRKCAKGRGQVFFHITAVLVIYIWLTNLWRCSFFGEKSSLSSTEIPWAGRKSCSVIAVGAENCSQSALVQLPSPALVFTLIPVTLLSIHWFDFNILSWIWIPCAHSLGRVCLCFDGLFVLEI